MRVISTRTHGAIDYLTGAGLLAAPALLGISDEPVAARALRAAGLAATARAIKVGILSIREWVELRAWRYEGSGASRRMMQTSVRPSYPRVSPRKEPSLCLS